jgi:hypothetical protein
MDGGTSASPEADGSNLRGPERAQTSDDTTMTSPHGGGSGGGSNNTGRDTSDTEGFGVDRAPGTPSGGGYETPGTPGGPTDPTDLAPSEPSSESGAETGTASTTGGGSSNPISSVDLSGADSKSDIRNRIASNTNLEPGEDFTVQRDGNQYNVQYTEAYQRQRFAQRLDDAYSRVNITSGDITAVEETTTEDGTTQVRPVLTDAARERITEAQVASNLGVSIGDIEYSTERGVVAETERGAEALAKSQLEQQTAGVENVDTTQVAPGVVKATGDPTSGDAPAPGASTVAVATAGGEELLQDLQRYADVQANMLEEGRQGRLIEAGERRRDAAHRREQANQGMLRQAVNEGIDPDRLEAETGRDIDQDGDVTTPEEYVASQVEDQFETIQRGQDFKIVEGEDGRLRVEYTDRGLTAIETELESESGQRLTVERAEDGSLDVARDTSERFGNAEVLIPFTGGETVEGALEGTVEFGQGLGRASGEALQYVSPLDDESGVDQTLRGVGEGSGALITAAPGFLLLGKEAGEATGYLAKSGSWDTLVNRSDAIVGAGVKAGKQAVEYAKKNPYRTGGQLLGAAVVGGAAVKGVSAYSAGAARAGAIAIQPGEEIAVRGLTSAASRTAAGQRAIASTPGKRLRGTDVARLTGRSIRSRAPSIDGAAVRRSLAEANAQTPSIEVVTNPDGPRFVADNKLGQQTLENARRALEARSSDLSLDDIAQRATIASINLRTGLQELRNRAPTGRNVGERVGDASAGSVGRRIGELAGRAGDTARDRTPFDVLDRTNSAGADIGTRVGQGVRTIGELGSTAGQRIGGRIQTETQPSTVNIRKANAAIAARAGLQRLNELEQRIGFLGADAGETIGRTVQRGLQRTATGDAAVQLDIATSAAQNRLTQLTDAIQAGSRRTGEAVGETIRRASTVRDIGVRIRAPRPPRQGSGRRVDFADLDELEGTVDLDEGDLDAFDQDATVDADTVDADAGTANRGGNGLQTVVRADEGTIVDAEARAETSQRRPVPFEVVDTAEAAGAAAAERVSEIASDETQYFDGFDRVFDTTAEQAADISVDLAQDLGVESAVDAGVVAGAGVGLDVGVDAGVDAGLESVMEATQDIESQTEQVLESGRESAAESNFDIATELDEGRLLGSVEVDSRIFETSFADFDAF